MSEIIISRIEKRLRKVESKVNDIKDHYEEMDNSMEDIYDTINNFKSPDNTNPNLNNHDHENKDKDTNNKKISKYIDSLINEDNSLPPYIKRKALTFYNKLVQNQSQLDFNSICNHISYFINQTDEQRDMTLNTLTDIFDLTDNNKPQFFKIINSNLDAYHKKIALNKLKMLETMKTSDNEYFKLSQWIDNFLEIPFNTFKTPSYLDESVLNNTCKYITDSRTHLNNIIYGQNPTKQHILEILAKMITNPKTLGSVFAIHGEAGTGKTTLIKDGLSKVFGLPFVFISLGGAHDRATLAGSSYVYEGSSCGKILQSLKQSQCMNPIFYFDELDKVSQTDKGIEIINLLVHLTDYTQNSHFMDDYMDGVAIDLSRATFIFSFNNKNLISPILLDRMEIIKFKSYSTKEKTHIAKYFLLPNIINNIFGENTNLKFKISDKSLENIANESFNSYIANTNDVVDVSDVTNNTTKMISGNKLLSGHKIKNKLINKNKNKIYNKYNFKYKCKNISGFKTNLIGGVRYIKKRLERILSRINIDIITGKIIVNNNDSDDDSNTKSKNKNKSKYNKTKAKNTNLIKTNLLNQSSNEIVINDEMINDILCN